MVRLGAVTTALVFALALLASFASAASAQESPRVNVTFEPKRITARELAGCQPTGVCPPLERDETYSTAVTLTVGVDSDPLFMDIEGGGLEISATANGDESTRTLRAGQSQRIDLTVTIPEPSGRDDRMFYYGKVRFIDSDGRVVAVLPVVATLPTPRVYFSPVRDPVTNEVPPLRTIIGAGQSFTREYLINSNINLDNFELRTNAPGFVRLENVPSELAASQQARVRLTYDAPNVNRRTKVNLDVRPLDGLQLINSLLRIRITILPLQIKWDPPVVRRELVVQTQRPERVTVQLRSNYDVNNVEVRTVDLGLMPVLSPINTINLRANEPVDVTFNICPGYAATRYYMSMAVYFDGKPLKRLLPIRAIVRDDGTGRVPTEAPPCQGT
ncbi:MAG: hypothetical protein EPO26_01065 [Chloroflexota bacterium]|nr:MAG: hypothetical protein EPO26_01065 [Chloroflexota bacterium]